VTTRGYFSCRARRGMLSAGTHDSNPSFLIVALQFIELLTF
jgi:hypothetical protein